MGLRHQNQHKITIRSYSKLLILSLLFTSSFIFFSSSLLRSPLHEEPLLFSSTFHGDLRDANFPWNKLCFGPTTDKLKLAVYSKKWPIDSSPGGMERHASTLYHQLASRGHEIHVFTVPSDRKPHSDIHETNLHVYFAANDLGVLNCSLAFEIFNKENSDKKFDYVHTESVSLPPWRAKTVPDLAVTWHGIWYEIMHSKLVEELFSNPKGTIQSFPMTELQESMPRLLDEIRFFSNYNQHICITNSAGEVLTNIYQLPPRNVHVILNGVDNTKFVHNPESGMMFRSKFGVPENTKLVIGVAGRLVKDKGHPLLYEAFSLITKNHPNVYLLVAGSGPWGRRYAELGSNVKVLGDLESTELSDFYNAIDVFVNPTMRPQGLDLTLIEAMHCGKAVLSPNYPSIVGTVVVNGDLGYTFSPNVKSLVEGMELVIRDGKEILKKKGMSCKEYAVSMFTAEKMASAYERFFLCMKNHRFCQFPLPTDC